MSIIGRNYYQITGFTSTAATGVYALVTKLSPQEALNIDTKMDDGKPLTGLVRGAFNLTALNGIQAKTYTTAGTAGTVAPTGVIADCIWGDGTNAPNTVYNLRSEDLANFPSCQLRVRASF